MAADHSFDPVDETFARANPNPERAGCPDKGVLRDLAAKRLPMDDPAYMHLAQCSPCYAEVRGMQNELSARRPRSRAWAAIAAAIILTLGCYLWFSRHQRAPGPALARNDAGTASIPTTLLDLRPYAVERSDRSRPDNRPSTLRRLRQKLEITLPVGSPAGRYELNIISPQGDVVQRASGEAAIVDGLTTIAVTLNLRDSAPSTLTLALRHESEGWRTYPARVE
jgi:hypothetical protein